jgi:hypothetical protein
VLCLLSYVGPRGMPLGIMPGDQIVRFGSNLHNHRPIYANLRI